MKSNSDVIFSSNPEIDSIVSYCIYFKIYPSLSLQILIQFLYKFF